jgi:acyl transferase domain-containing protein
MLRSHGDGQVVVHGSRLACAARDLDGLRDALEDAVSQQDTDAFRTAAPPIVVFMVGGDGASLEGGVQPKACIGHSIGEVAAFHEASFLSEEDAVKIVFNKGRLRQKQMGGAMAVVTCSQSALEQVLGNLDARESRAEIAAETAQLAALSLVSPPPWNARDSHPGGAA